VEIAIPAENKKPSYIPAEDELDYIAQPVIEDATADEEDDDLALFMNLFAEDEDTMDDVLFDDTTDADEETGYSVDYDADKETYSSTEEEDDLFADDFAIEDFQFAFDEDDEEEVPSYEESDEFDELDLDSLDDIAGSDFAIPRSQYQVQVVFELTLEELMEMTDEY
jgi:hypothetical protein